MKHCKNCGAESPDDAPSCIVCGYKFTNDEVNTVWVIYTIYDTYLCANAIQNDEDLPLFVNLWDIRY